MDPTKQIGKMKEQVLMENRARRNFSKKWQKLADPQLNKFYNPDEINQQLKEHCKLQDLCPFTYSGEGDSFFFSRDMYNSLLAKCRCGRSRTGTHILKCSQRAQEKYLNTTEAEDTACNDSKMPETTNALIGWQKRKPDYKQWEDSMKYISPVYTMPGHKIDSKPYNVVFIG